MALEGVIFQQDPFLLYGYNKDYNYNIGDYMLPMDQEEKPKPENLNIVNCKQLGSNGCNWDFPTPQNTSSSQETCGDMGFNHGSGGGGGGNSMESQRIVATSRRKRRRTKSLKNKEEIENQRMTHIAVERNRRRQMNDYLAILRSLMPPSYSQRGDQASIVGGAINYVKELEQLLQFLESHKPTNQQPNTSHSKPFSNFFNFPQYSTSGASTSTGAADLVAERLSGIVDIEVALVETHANIKILSKRRPKQLLKIVSGFQSIFLTVLHLNITTIDQSILYSFNCRVEDGCRLSTVNEIATAVHDMMEIIQE